MHLDILNSARDPVPIGFLKREYPLDHIAIQELIDWGMIQVVRKRNGVTIVQTHDRLRQNLSRINNFEMVINDFESYQRNRS